MGMFEKSYFIKASQTFERDFTGFNHAPVFRKRFEVKDIQNAKLAVCGLGYGYYYINGIAVTEDKFTAPVSNYEKTLWYQVYDVTELLRVGENVIAVWCGNGWYNEEFRTSWNYDQASWRDDPKFILELEINGDICVVSDDTWKCQEDSAVWFNALRSGEYFDARKYEENWNHLEFDDGGWKKAIKDPEPPRGILRECLCEPIREKMVLSAKEIFQTDNGTLVYDFGQNISGYVRMHIRGEEGQVLTIRYAEEINEDRSRNLNEMTIHYPESEFQTDKFICSGKPITWSPKFTYHGFRYIEIEGLNSLEQAVVEAVFVHQDVDIRTEFECSDEFLNRLFHAGQMSTLSNMFYSMTDCPTREKLGWMNDAQASMDQILTDFCAENVMEKWLQDIEDAMREDGALPGIVPTSGWGYDWGNGPVSDGTLFELPYQIYRHTGNAEPLVNAYPFFMKYLNYMEACADEDGFVRFGLHDWAKPGFDTEEKDPDVPVEFINALLIREFVRIAMIAAEKASISNEKLKDQYDKLTEQIKTNYILPDGTCSISAQTAVAMLICYDVYEDLAPLKRQLKQLIEEHEFRHDCGMVGLGRLYTALNKCGLQEYAYRIVTADGYPSYRKWFELGATTLWECWERRYSKNHHMYSSFMAWMVKTILGITQDEGSVGFKMVHVDPCFFAQLDYAKGCCNTVNGRLRVSWERDEKKIRLCVDVPQGMTVYHGAQKLHDGMNEILCDNI